MQISFHGGAGTVTGSKHLLTLRDQQILIDAGLFQGLKELRALNWRKPTFDPAAVDHLLLTHTHIDHAGYLPRLVREGYTGPVHCTPATGDLARLLLLDAAHIQEEDAAYANRKGFSKHRPALPLYTRRDVDATLRLMRPVDFETWIDLEHGVRARFLNAGHILGSAMVELEIERPGTRTLRAVFSGDVGRYDMPLHVDPRPLPPCDILVVESTYGNRLHDHQPLEEQIVEPFTRTFERGGVVLIPSFAVGRAQQITLILRRLMKAGRLPEVPIHIDSPMAVDATRIYSKYLDEHNLDACLSEDGRSRLFPEDVYFHRSVDDSKRLNAMDGQRIIISSSGMMTGGRILHHLRRRLPDRRNLLCLVGYQAVGTRGRRLLDGARELRMHGQDVAVDARFLSLHGMSGHADRDELLRWIRSDGARPRRVFVTHGEPDAAISLSATIEAELGAMTIVPGLGDRFELDDLDRVG
ncbi:MAG: MBL fold metallo-hydrolase [Candidatus Eiseniibacteriota bacterium]